MATTKKKRREFTAEQGLGYVERFGRSSLYTLPAVDRLLFDEDLELTPDHLTSAQRAAWIRFESRFAT